MKYLGMLLIGILGFIIGEGISRAIRKDTTAKGDDFTGTWILKLICAIILMGLVYDGC